jgi:hypothetical protein
LITHLGSKTVGAICIGLSAIALPSLAHYLDELAAKVADYKARLDAYVKISAHFTSPAALITQLEAAILGLKDRLAAIVAGAIPAIPTATASVTADLGLVLPKFAALQLIIDELKLSLSAGGVHAYSVDGDAASVGSDLGATIAGGLPWRRRTDRTRSRPRAPHRETRRRSLR